MLYCRYMADRAEYYKVNLAKMVVFGYGYGGFIALHSLRKNIVPCAVAIGPITDLRNLGKRSLDECKFF